jgi:Bacterial conjugation TrbI-like protein
MMDTDELKVITGTTELGGPLITAAEFSAEESKSSRPIWSMPGPKIVMAALLLMPAVAIAGTFLTGGGHSESAQPLGDANQPSAKPKPVTNQDEEQMQQEIARLKAKSALDGQAKLEKQLAKQPNSKPVTAVQNSSSKSGETAAQPSASTAATTVAIRSEPPKIATAAVSRPEVIPMRESSTPSRAVDRSEMAPPKEVIPPQERWQQALKLGSYGAVRPESAQVPEAVASVKPAPMSELQAKLTTWSRQGDVVVPTVEPSNRPGDVAVLTVEPSPPELPGESQSTSLIAGTNAAAVFETPVVLDDGKSSERFTVLLSEPIPDASGRTALPVNTKLTVQVEGISQAGRVQLAAMSATWNQSGQTKEMTLPAGAIQIRGIRGQPLVAQQFQDKGKELAALDRGQFILSAIRGASGQLIQPNTSVQTGNGSTVVTQQNPRPNILAGALQGGADTLLTTIGERNKKAVEEIQQRPPIRYIAAGTPVQVFVNQSVQLPL